MHHIVGIQSVGETLRARRHTKHIHCGKAQTEHWPTPSADGQPGINPESPSADDQEQYAARCRTKPRHYPAHDGEWYLPSAATSSAIRHTTMNQNRQQTLLTRTSEITPNSLLKNVASAAKTRRKRPKKRNECGYT